MDNQLEKAVPAEIRGALHDHLQELDEIEMTMGTIVCRLNDLVVTMNGPSPKVVDETEREEAPLGLTSQLHQKGLTITALLVRAQEHLTELEQAI